MELRAITSMDELSELVSACTFDEFYQKIVGENRRYDDEYYEAYRARRLRQTTGLKKIVFENWSIFGKIIRLRDFARGEKHPKESYQNRPFLWFYEKGKYQFIPDKTFDARPFFDSAKDIYNNIEQYRATYELLADEASKNVLMGLLMSRLTNDIRRLAVLKSKNPQYFDSDVIKSYANEVVADAGGYIGDTAQALLETPEAKGKIKKIYLYEPDGKNMERAKKNLSKFDVEVVFRRAGVSDKRGSLFITGTAASARLTADIQEKDKVDVVVLDEDIEEKVTLIKMDIEGSEKAALRGCQRHILEDAPRLAICVYHKLDDVYWLPRYVKSLNPEYKFYLRHYDPYGIGETVMYCLPRRKEDAGVK